MSFSADWLALRRAADLRARSADLTRMLARALTGRNACLRVLDLGAGTGANLAALAPRLPGGQVWTLVDNDPGLLDCVTPPEGVDVDNRVADIAADLDALFRQVPDLVTASAFFDLCGAALSDAIVARTVQAGAAFLAVLSYDGREEWEPPHPSDADVLAAFHADQRRDKGLGPALGPEATAHLARGFRAAGYRVATRQSDWRLSAPRDAELIKALAEGSAAAVRDRLGTGADDWKARHIGARLVIIGHRDLLALPPDA